MWTKVTFQTETLPIDLLRDTTLLSVQQWKYPRAGRSSLLMIWWLGKKTGLIDKAEFKDCFKDPSRVFNQDETSIQVGSDNGKVLAEKGTKFLYCVGGSSREHVCQLVAVVFLSGFSAKE